MTPATGTGILVYIGLMALGLTLIWLNTPVAEKPVEFVSGIIATGCLSAAGSALSYRISNYLDRKD